LGAKSTTRTQAKLFHPGYRSHGSLYEVDVPLVIYNAAIDLPPSDLFRFNFDLTRIPFSASA